MYMVAITAEEQNKLKRMKRTEDSLRDLWDNIKCTNIRIIGVPDPGSGQTNRRWVLYPPILPHLLPPFPLIPTRLIRRSSYRFFPQILQECPGASPGPSCCCIVRSPHWSSAAVHPPPPSPGDSPLFSSAECE